MVTLNICTHRAVRFSLKSLFIHLFPVTTIILLVRAFFYISQLKILAFSYFMALPHTAYFKLKDARITSNLFWTVVTWCSDIFDYGSTNVSQDG